MLVDASKKKKHKPKEIAFSVATRAYGVTAQVTMPGKLIVAGHC
jgi:hypothetical protein